MPRLALTDDEGPGMRAHVGEGQDECQRLHTQPRHAPGVLEEHRLCHGACRGALHLHAHHVLAHLLLDVLLLESRARMVGEEEPLSQTALATGSTQACMLACENSVLLAKLAEFSVNARTTASAPPSRLSASMSAAVWGGAGGLAQG